MCVFVASSQRQPLQVLNQLSKLLESFSGALESFGHKAGSLLTPKGENWTSKKVPII